MLPLAAVILLAVLLIAGAYWWWKSLPEVYYYGVYTPQTPYTLSYEQAKAAAAKMGGVLATTAQVAAAQAAGAQWCGWGWTESGGGAPPVVTYPHQVTQGCDSGTHPGVNVMASSPDTLWGAAIYGVKPARAPPGVTILNWNDAAGSPPGTAPKWSRYSL